MVVTGFDVNGDLHHHSPLEEQLQATLNIVPAYAWYASPHGALTFVNERTADYLGLPGDHPLRFGIGTGADWDSHIPLLHADDREETRRVWSDCLRTGCAGDVSFRVRNAVDVLWRRDKRLHGLPNPRDDGTSMRWKGYRE